MKQGRQASRPCSAGGLLVFWDRPGIHLNITRHLQKTAALVSRRRLAVVATSGSKKAPRAYETKDRQAQLRRSADRCQPCCLEAEPPGAMTRRREVGTPSLGPREPRQVSGGGAGEQQSAGRAEPKTEDQQSAGIEPATSASSQEIGTLTTRPPSPVASPFQTTIRLSD